MAGTTRTQMPLAGNLCHRNCMGSPTWYWELTQEGHSRNCSESRSNNHFLEIIDLQEWCISRYYWLSQISRTWWKTSVKVFLNSKGHLLHKRWSRKREGLPASPHGSPLTRSLFCAHYWSSLSILDVLPHLHTFASIMWQSSYSPQSFRETPEEGGGTKYLLMSWHTMKFPDSIFPWTRDLLWSTLLLIPLVFLYSLTVCNAYPAVPIPHTKIKHSNRATASDQQAATWPCKHANFLAKPGF